MWLRLSQVWLRRELREDAIVNGYTFKSSTARLLKQKSQSGPERGGSEGTLPLGPVLWQRSGGDQISQTF